MQVESPSPSLQALPAPLARALSHLVSVQQPGGYWEAEMVWNSMLLSQYVLTRKITGRWPLSDAERDGAIRHFQVTQLPDGSWPMHGEGPGYVYMTSMAYVALRTLGLGPDHPLLVPARRWLRQEGVLGVPSWGKFWLAMLGLYGWDGVNPIPPELFLLPDWVPVQPNNFYCHTRYIYLGIGYLYGKRFTFDLGPLRDELRQELYGQPYGDIDFSKHRHNLASRDVYVRPSRPLRLAWDILARLEKRIPARLRRAALDRCYGRIEYEVEASRGQGLSPVNAILNILALHSENPAHPRLASSLEALETWRWWDDAEGIRYAGAHSTAWDTAFAMRAMLAAPSLTTSVESLSRGYAWFSATQLQEELPEIGRQRREPIVGGWCFSDGVHRWPVSDCTAEALTAVLGVHQRLQEHPELVTERISDERLAQAAQFILRRQNDDGGFGSYERRRGSVLLEWVNPSEMYGNCMTERSYTECTASCVGALARFAKAYPHVLEKEIASAIGQGIKLLKSRQLSDGSYLGFWGVNFTYAAFHVIEALSAAGVPATDPAIARAASWLLGKQKSDGGWGEHWSSCMTETYVEHPESQAAMTAWATLALLESIEPSNPAIRRGLECLISLQALGTDGAWPQQSQSGVFFSTAMLDYRLYKDYFPTWALARATSLSRS